MARILYTRTERGREVAAFVEADDLASAEAKLAPLRSDQIRFWTHPFFGDAEGATPADALRGFPRAAGSGTTWAVIVGLAVTAPGALLAQLWWVAGLVDIHVERPWLLGIYSMLSFCGFFWISLPAFKRLRAETNERHYGLASALLWGLRLGCPPMALLFERWAVRIATGRTDVERAMARHAWLRWIGLSAAYDWLHDAAVSQVNDHAARRASLQAKLAKGPNALASADLAMLLVLYDRDVAGARAALADAGKPTRPLLVVWHQMVRGVIAAETGDASAALELTTLHADYAKSAPAVLDDLTPILHALCARAYALNDDVDAAVAALRRATPGLLATSDVVPLDRAAEAIVAAEARAGLRPRSSAT